MWNLLTTQSEESINGGGARGRKWVHTTNNRGNKSKLLDEEPLGCDERSAKEFVPSQIRRKDS